MKFTHPWFFAACFAMLAVPAFSQTLWYNGDATGPSAYANGADYSNGQTIVFVAGVYDDFTVPAPGWNVTGVFENSYFPAGSLPTSASWQIRSGMSTAPGGALVANGSSNITPVATGRTAMSGSLVEYTLQFTGLAVPLPAGQYWLTVIPNAPTTGAPTPLASQTSGANCIGTPCGNDGNSFLSNFSAISGTVDFSMGVAGTVASSTLPPVVCQVYPGVAPTIRAEGIVEQVSDLTLNCAGGTPTPTSQAIPTINLQVSQTTPFTSRVLTGSFSEAMLMFDEPNAGSAAVPNQTVAIPPAGSPPQQLCAASAAPCAELGTGGSPSPYQTQPNIFLGQQTTSEVIAFDNIPFDPPGPSANRIVRITNMRANASQLPLSQTSTPTSISATLSTSSSLISILGPTQTTAFLQPTLMPGAVTGSVSQCTSHNPSLIGGTGTPDFDFDVTAKESFASSFRRRDIGLTVDGPTAPSVYAQNVPGYPYLDESGFYAPALFTSSTSAGLADFGARILLTFNNLAAGVRLFVPLNVTLVLLDGMTASQPPTPPAPVPNGVTFGQIQLVQADQYGNSTLPGYTSVAAVASVQGTPVAEVNYTGTTAYATYEVVDSDPNAVETAIIPVAVAFNSSGSVPAAGQFGVNVSAGPAGGPSAGIQTADATAPIPRFLNDSVAQTAFSITSCTTQTTTVTTNPPGLSVTIDGTAMTAPQSFSWTPGSMHTIAVTSPQGNLGSMYTFASWSDSGAISHTVTVPSSSITYTANFSTQYFLTMTAGSGGSVNPPSGWFNAGQSVPISATPPGGMIVAGWVGSGAGSYSGETSNPSVMMNGPVSETAVFLSGLPPAPGPGFAFVPITPCRIADTRNPTGPYGGPSLGAAETRTFAITASACGIPTNAQAFALNITVVPLGPLGFLSVWPAGQAQPAVSTLNSSDGRIKANAAIVPAGTGGSIDVFASNPTNVILDINGYFITPGAQTLAFYPIAPCRIADTRSATGTFGGPSLAATESRNFPILSSACNIPATAQAYSLNFTVVPSGPLGFLSAWPAGSPQPGVSTLNAPKGNILANAAIVPAGTGGAITVIATNATNLIIDVNGYFAPPGASGALLFRALTPCRILDTRGTDGPFGGPALAAAVARAFVVTLSSCQVPSAAQAYSLNATVVPPAPLGFVTLWGSGSQPGVSTLNDSDGSIVANAAIVPAASDGSVSVFASNITNLILDINGYFAP